MYRIREQMVRVGETAQEHSDVTIVLAMNESPPKDLPEGRLVEFPSLDVQVYYNRVEEAATSRLCTGHAVLEEAVLV